MATTRAQSVAQVQQSSGGPVPPQAAGKNAIINGAFNVWQRGTSFTGANAYAYTADRWAYRDANGTPQVISQVTTGLPTGFRYGIKMGRAAAATGTSGQYLVQGLETTQSISLASQSVTLSFYAKKGANYSPTQVAVLVATGTGTDQAINGTTGGIGAWTGYAAVIDTTLTAATLTTSYVRYTYTGTVSSGATQIGILLQQNGVGTAGADDYLYITGVQLEVGSTATPFQTASGTIGGELALCQRYYYRQGGQSAYQIVSTGLSATTTTYVGYVYPQVAMRVTPTSIDYATLCVQPDPYGGIIAVTSVTNASAGYNLLAITATVASGLTAFQNNRLETNNSTSGYLGFSAEL